MNFLNHFGSQNAKISMDTKKQVKPSCLFFTTSSGNSMRGRIFRKALRFSMKTTLPSSISRTYMKGFGFGSVSQGMRSSKRMCMKARSFLMRRDGEGMSHSKHIMLGTPLEPIHCMRLTLLSGRRQHRQRSRYDGIARKVGKNATGRSWSSSF